MITILPDKDILKYQSTMKDINESTVVLKAENDGQELGYIAFNIEDKKALLVTLYDKDLDSIIADALLRAAFSYLLNRNIFIFESHKQIEAFKKFDFKNDNGRYFIDLAKIKLRCSHS